MAAMICQVCQELIRQDETTQVLDILSIGPVIRVCLSTKFCVNTDEYRSMFYFYGDEAARLCL